MNIRDAKNYIEEFAKFGSKPGLERIQSLVSRLGHPEEKVRMIHVAGTNGKGSVCTYIYTILNAAGIRTGCFTSPAVMEYRERFRIAGRSVSQAALCRSLETVKAAVDAMLLDGEDSPTQFEVETALAFQLFADTDCEVAVIECGMGGELDSTNVIRNPLACVLTSISLDHMAVLGKSLDAITRQKAGIIKQHSHVVTIEQSPEVINVIKAKCSLEKADLTIIGRGEIANTKWGLRGSSFDYGKRKGLRIGLVGINQTDNAAIAVAAIDALRKEHIKIDDESIYKGLRESEWPGRFDIIAKKPMFILDGAHNEDAAKKLSESVEYFLHNEEEAGKLILIMGVLADKNYDAVVKYMAPHGAHVITITPPDNPRALPALTLAETVKKYNNMVSVAGSITEALEMAYLLADDQSVIIAFGSLSFLGEMRRQVESRGVVLRKKETKI